MRTTKRKPLRSDPASPLPVEILNTVTHGIGLVLSIAGLVWLVLRATANQNTTQVVSFSIYGATLILMYLASSLYHGIQHPRLKAIFVRLDHSAIYLLIAGSYTPFLLLGVGGWIGWSLLALIWGLALFGVGYKAIYYRHGRPLLWLYLLMGWLSLIALPFMSANLPLGGLIWLFAGGLAYTVGVIFYAIKRIPALHIIWHLFVLTGSACHYVAVMGYLTRI